jgi:hypothetical protein
LISKNMAAYVAARARPDIAAATHSV